MPTIMPSCSVSLRAALRLPAVLPSVRPARRHTGGMAPRHSLVRPRTHTELPCRHIGILGRPFQKWCMVGLAGLGIVWGRSFSSTEWSPTITSLFYILATHTRTFRYMLVFHAVVVTAWFYERLHTPSSLANIRIKQVIIIHGTGRMFCYIIRIHTPGTANLSTERY